MQITIMSYNIERGFHSRDHKLQKERLIAAQNAIKSVNPDILAITEACYGRKNSYEIIMDYQKLFGFSYGEFSSYPEFGPRKGDEGGNCLLSQYSMDVETVKLAFKGAVRSKIFLEDKIFTIDVIHPSYSVDDQEKINTLKPLISSRNSPYLLTGDFNTVHPTDKYDWDLLRNNLMDFNPKIADQVIANWQRADFVNWLMELGLRDSFPVHKRDFTVPTNYGCNHTNTGVRMDFFFISSGIEVLDSYVLKNKYTQIASDHYPIVGVFNIK